MATTRADSNIGQENDKEKFILPYEHDSNDIRNEFQGECSETVAENLVNSNNGQTELQNEKSVNRNTSKRDTTEESEQNYRDKPTTSDIIETNQPCGRYPNKGSLPNRFDLSENKNSLCADQSTVTKNDSNFATIMKDCGNLKGILDNTEDYSNGESTVQVLNAQVKSLREKLEISIREYVGKENIITELEQRLKKSEVSCAELRRDNNNKNQQIVKMEKAANSYESTCDELKRELTTISKDAEVLKHGQKQAAAVKSNLETKLAQTNDDKESLRAENCQLKQTIKEMEKNYEKKIEDLVKENKRVEKLKSELHSTVKKQMQLISILKRQKLHVESAVAVQFKEEEFMKALDKSTINFPKLTS